MNKQHTYTTGRISNSTSKENIEAIFPLSATQEAFLYLREQTQSDPGVLTVEAELTGPLERGLFEIVWNQEVDRHEMLRASIRERHSKGPLLVIWKKIHQPILFRDLSHLDEASKQQSLAETIHQHRLDAQPDRAPYSQIAVATLAPEKHCLIWTFHHLFLDGWSTSLVIRNVLRRYEAMVSEVEFRTRAQARFKDYVSCANSGSSSETQEFWRSRFNGFRGHLKFDFTDPPSGSTSAHHPIERTLDRQSSLQLNDRLRCENLTANSIVTAAWALVLSRIFVEQDIGFGMAVSGRSLPVEGMQEMVGLCARVVPSRIKIADDLTIREWLTNIRDEQFDSQPHEYFPLSEIEATCPVGKDRIFFDSLLVVENFPLQIGNTTGNQLTLTKFKSGTTSAFGLTGYALPGKTWTLRIEYAANLFSSETASHIADQFLENIRRLSEVTMDLNVSELRTSSELAIEFEGVKLRLPAADSDNWAIVDHLDQRNETELQLTCLWEAILGTSNIGLDESFFDLGGKSFKAVRMISRIEELFGIRYAPTVLIENPTIRQLATLLDDGKPPSSESLVRFNRVEQGNPIVCVHVGGGYATYYRHLAKHLPGVPVVGLQTSGLEVVDPLQSFEKLASYFVEQLNGAFAERQYHLVGYCMGGALALEMARQLQSRGRPAQFLTIVDTGPKWGPRRKRLPEFIAQESSRRKGVGKFVALKGKKLLRPHRDLLKRTYLRFFGDLRQQREFDLYRVKQICTRAFRTYKPKPAAAPIKLIRSAEYDSMPEKNFHLDWKHLTTNEFSVDVVDSKHQKILLEPAVAHVARMIRENSYVGPVIR